MTNNRRSEIDEQLLLKEWDFTRFFQGFNEKLDKMKQEASSSSSSKIPTNEERSSSSGERTLKRFELAAKRKTEPPQQKPQQQLLKSQQQQQQPQQQQQKTSNQKHLSTTTTTTTNQQQLKSVHRRQESDSKISNSNAFSRAFRRESSDFFPSTRHSAYLQKSEPRASLFSSGNRRGSEISIAGITGKKKNSLITGEPVLTDFSFVNDKPQRPRREKTESEIVFGNKNNDYLREQQQQQQQRTDSRRRSCRPIDGISSDDAGTIKSTASTTASEYSPVITQVSLVEVTDCQSLFLIFPFSHKHQHNHFKSKFYLDLIHPILQNIYIPMDPLITSPASGNYYFIIFFFVI